LYTKSVGFGFVIQIRRIWIYHTITASSV